MITLKCGTLTVELCEPGTYYQGTRFDWCGVFRRISLDGYCLADEWFDVPDPLRHDNVCGPSEEFYGAYGYDAAPVGGAFLKIGVGLLVRDSDNPYDWFHRYPILDGGEFSVRTIAGTHGEEDSQSCEFSHKLAGKYLYIKEIVLTSENTFEIRHRLENLSGETLEIDTYCHNFFTFNGAGVSASRRIVFPGEPHGHWRADSVKARLEGNALLFVGELQPGEKAYIGDLAVRGYGNSGYNFTLREGENSVEVRSDKPMDHMVMWACSRVACPEPYIHLSIAPGASAAWTCSYRITLFPMTKSTYTGQ